MMKRVKVYTGTDIPFCSPSHPFSAAVQVKRIVDRIVASADSEFEYNCNTKEGVEMFERYGHEVKGLDVRYHINGKPATFQQVLEDFGRGLEFLTETIAPQCK